MKFIDEAEVDFTAGNGGPGARRFRREKFVPLGGPDGGDGGRGGSVIVFADRNKHTLLDLTFTRHMRAEDGQSGGGANKTGKAGADLRVGLPIGTQIFRREEGAEDTENVSNELVVDLAEDGQEFELCKGGRGGRGNAFFKSATNQAPEHAQQGEAGTSGSFLLSLKLVADVGLIGFPNAGKSTLISRISSARPKIADYPFTTLTPNLGLARIPGGRSFVIADIPGLIPGAHLGKGLGIQFLKHIERTKVLAHLIDPLQLDENGELVPAEESFRQINIELDSFSQELAHKRQLVVITKIDAISDRTEIEKLINSFRDKGHECVAISSASGEGLEQFLRLISHELRE